MVNEKQIIKDYLSELGKKGGASKSPQKISAVNKNLVIARQNRWKKKKRG